MSRSPQVRTAPAVGHVPSPSADAGAADRNRNRLYHPVAVLSLVRVARQARRKGDVNDAWRYRARADRDSARS